jgi:hypothetical protein
MTKVASTHLVLCGNRAHLSGGMSLRGSDSDLKDVLFSGNEATLERGGGGGGLYAVSSSAAVLDEVRFLNNHSRFSGGGMLGESYSPTIKNSSFVSNTAVIDGGGMYNNYSNPDMVNVSFLGNEQTALSGGQGGGGLLNWYSSPDLTNVLFSGNNAGMSGGGMLNYNSSPLLINVTASGNRARIIGAGIGNVGTESAVTIQNTIVWNNEDAQGTGATTSSIWNGFGSPSITNSDIDNCGGSTAWSTSCGTDDGNNIDIDPQFIIPVNPANAATTDGNLHLHKGSQAIDVGENSFNGEPKDLAGYERKTHGDDNGSVIIDMGAYEAPTVDSGRIFVSKVTEPASDPQSFDFNLSGGPDNVDVDFPLSHDEFLYKKLLPGTYSVSETVPAIWDLSSALCHLNDPASPPTNAIDPANINLGAREIVICVFTNTKQSTVIMRRETLPDGSPEQFAYLN